MDSQILAAALLGGAMIGLAAGGLYLTTGRIAGISSLYGDAVLRRPQAWRWLFLAGLILAGLLARPLGLTVPEALGHGPLWLAAAGLLVGFGTRLGNGCTSGHGVCGLARLSWRSLTAVLVFMATAGVTVYVVRHILKAA
ncbi:hypothetical protein ABAC460_07305 [Asticcacaulis sp. AC460]|uniref:YeeE/YedE family protein n=1 Tax=Asticcacaulis sp. AC460 TaxID=1282360 RepID=UPI0003C404C8|nr:YeeE/YedE thiosulfate transporter family protein [Asticcacaulis sp. AC460]ESQ91092.1 hypothetical protein ABAC460_07305 [Asticcacaulis sp. AC460]